MAEWSLAVLIRLSPLINYMSTAILYMYICIYMLFDCLQNASLKKGSTAETSWENKGKNSGFDFSFI